MGYHIGVVVDGLGINEWVDANVLGGKWYAQAHNIELDIAAPQNIDPDEQIAVIRDLVNRKPDALVVMPIRGEAVDSALAYARKQHVVVVTEDMLVRTDSPVLDVRFDSTNAGARAAEGMLDRFREAYGEIPEGDVVVLLSKKNPHQSERANGFKSVMEKRDELNLIDLDVTPCAEMTDLARQGVSTLLDEKNVVGCFGYGNLVTIGIAHAIEDVKRFRSPGSRDHVVVTGIDACPQTIDLMKMGKIDMLIDQPCSFYIPISLHYAVKYLEEGEEGLPQKGDVISENELVIEGADPFNVKPWSVQTWSPAELVEVFNHRWFKTSFVEVVPENCGESWLWGNFIRKTL